MKSKIFGYARVSSKGKKKELVVPKIMELSLEGLK